MVNAAPLITGRCLCSALTYEYAGELGPASYCHCVDCRRVTGSAFNVSVRMVAARFRIASGATASFTKAADSGAPVTRHFCPGCGSPLFTTHPSRPEFLWIKAGSLDEPAVVVPSYQSWTRSRVKWSCIGSGLLAFPEGRV